MLTLQNKYRKKHTCGIVTEQERSLAVCTRPRPSHAIRKAESVRAIAFQTRGYWSESGWDEFKSKTVRI